MKINKIMIPIPKRYYSDKELLYMYFDKIIDMESLSKKDDNYEINRIVLDSGIRTLKYKLSKTQYGKLIGVDIWN